MKSRIRNKQRKKEIDQFIFKPLKKAGIKLALKKWINGYFIFNFGKNSVCHFEAEGLPYVRFAVWNTSAGLELFGDDYVHMDKFKPTCCTNFTPEELVKMLVDYKNKKITLQDIIVKYLGYDYDEYLWVQAIDIETGDDVYSQKVNMTPKQFEKYYISQYEERVFKDNHSGLNPEEYETAEIYLKSFVNELCESDYIDSIYVHRNLPFFRDWASIEVMYSDKCFELTDEEFNNLDKYWYEKITGINGDKRTDTFIIFNFTGISEKGSIEFAHELMNNDIKNWTIYKEDGKRIY